MPKRRALVDLADQIRTDASRLVPDQLAARLAEWTRGGLPASSINGDNHTHCDRPMPEFDRDDRTWQRIMADYHRALSAAAQQLDRARQIQRAYLPPPAGTEAFRLWRAEHERAARGDVGPNAVACADCSRVVACTTADPIRNDRCSACNQRHRRHASRSS